MPQLNLLHIPANEDVVYTPDEVARDVVNFFNPSGSILEPAAGDGAFLRYLPTAAWCELTQGRDFFAWSNRVDWVIGNPPYSIFAEWLRHSFEIADNIVYVIPINKVFNSNRTLKDIYTYGGVKTIFVIGGGHNTHIRWKLGFAVGAVHFQRGYTGGIQGVFRTPPNKRVQADPLPAVDDGDNSTSAGG